MRKIILGFDHEKTQKAIAKEFTSLNQLDIEFEKHTSKQSVMDAIRSGDAFAVLLTEKCGGEKWTVQEFAELKDLTTIKIVPILSPQLASQENLLYLYEHLVLTAIIEDKKGVSSREIVNVLLKGRSPKEARTYYKISKLSEKESVDDVLSAERYMQCKKALFDPNYAGAGSSLGVKYQTLAGSMTVSQNVSFLGKLKQDDSDLLDDLKGTEEFYYILDVLNREGAKIQYEKPKNIKEYAQKRKQERKDEEPVMPVLTEENILGASEKSAEKVVEEDKTESVVPIQIKEDDDDDFGFSGIDNSEFANISTSTYEKEIIDDLDDDLEEDDDKEKNNTIVVVAVIAIASLLTILLIMFVIITVNRNKKANMNANVTTIYDVAAVSENEVATSTDADVDTPDVTDNNLTHVSADSDDENVEEEETVPTEIDFSIEEKESEEETPKNMTEFAVKENKKESATDNKNNTSNKTTTTQKPSSSIQATIEEVKNNISNKTSSVASKRDETSSSSTSKTNEGTVIEDIPTYDYTPAKEQSSYANKTLKEGDELSGLDVINIINASSGSKYIIRMKNGGEITLESKGASIGDVSSAATYVVSFDEKNVPIFTQK